MLVLAAGLAVFTSVPAIGQCVQVSELARLLGSNGATDDLFGSDVSIHADTMVVGVPNQDTAGANAGAAYVFVRAPGSNHWDLQAKLLAADRAAGDRFGSSVAVSGDTILVGAPNDDNAAGADAGAGYIFTRSNGVWTQRIKLLAGDGAAGDVLGTAVDLDGDVAVLGAIGDDVAGGTNQGSAYAFTGSGAAWVEQDKLLASDRASNDSFGGSVAVDRGATRNTILVGAATRDNPGGSDQGAAYVFTINTLVPGNDWTQQAKLVSPAGQSNDYFGSAVDLDGERAIVGVPQADSGAIQDCGAVCFFTRSFNTWSSGVLVFTPNPIAETAYGAAVAITGARAFAGAPDRVNGYVGVLDLVDDTWQETFRLFSGVVASSDAVQLGYSVAAHGDTLVSGAPRYNTADAARSGVAMVFQPVGTAWSSGIEVRRPTDDIDAVGHSVDVSGTVVVVGAPLDDTAGATASGAVYIFKRVNGAWSLFAKLAAPDAASGDRFGHSVAVSGNFLVVGAPHNGERGFQAGAIYTGVIGSSGEIALAKITASDAAVNDRFGSAVDVYGPRLTIVGAPADDVGAAMDAGSVYFFAPPGGGGNGLVEVAKRYGGSANSEAFGSSVAIGFGVGSDAARAVAGAPGNDASGTNAGAAYLFTLNQAPGAPWSAAAPLDSTGIAAGDAFGTSVSIQFDYIAVGAPNTDGPAGANQGAVYAYNLDLIGAPPVRLLASDAVPSSALGRAVAIEPRTLLAGAPFADGSQRGKVYCFHDQLGGSWSQQGFLVPQDRADFDNVGNAVAFDSLNGYAVIGAVFNDTSDQADTGSAYIVSVDVGQLPGFYGDQPLDQSSCISGTVTFSADLWQDPDTNYQWQRYRSEAEFQNISGAILPTLTLNPVTAPDATWRYRVVAVNPCGTATSRDAALVVCRPNFNCDLFINPTDVNIFVNTWFNSVVNGTLAGDFDGNGLVEPADVSLFINLWLAAVVNGC